MIKIFLSFFMAIGVSSAFASDILFSPLPYNTVVVKSTGKTLIGGNNTCNSNYYYKNEVVAHHNKCWGSGGETVHQILIIGSGKAIEVDMNQRTATIKGDLQTYMNEEYAKLSPGEQKIVKDNYKRFRFARNASFSCLPKVEQGELMGKPVEIVTWDNNRIHWGWVDGGIALKVKYPEFEDVATTVLTNVEISDEKLSVPDGIKAVWSEEGDTLTRKYARQRINRFKNPDLVNLPVCGNNS